MSRALSGRGQDRRGQDRGPDGPGGSRHPDGLDPALQRLLVHGQTGGPTANVELQRALADDHPLAAEPVEVQRAMTPWLSSPFAEGPVHETPVHEELRKPGQPVGGKQRTEVQRRLGSIRPGLRAHVGGSGVERALRYAGSEALTSGDHMLFSPRAYNNGDIVTEEADHAADQSKRRVAGTDHGDGLSMSDPGDRDERKTHHRVQGSRDRSVMNRR